MAKSMCACGETFETLMDFRVHRWAGNLAVKPEPLQHYVLCATCEKAWLLGDPNSKSHIHFAGTNLRQHIMSVYQAMPVSLPRMIVICAVCSRQYGRSKDLIRHHNKEHRPKHFLRFD